MVIAALLQAGCSALLPRGSSETRDSFDSYEEAKAAVESIVPYRSLRQHLDENHFDPANNAAIKVLNFAHLAQKFNVGPAVPADDLDRGVRDCLRAGKRCSAYEIEVNSKRRERTGNFWADAFNFRRTTDVTGWSFSALIVFVDDTVVYTLTGGQPRIREREVVSNPLGPLQSFGDAVGSAMIK